MRKKTKRLIKLVLKALLELAALVTYIVAFAKLFYVEDISSKVEYGVVVIVLTILFFDRD